MVDVADYCECQGSDYKGCLMLPNKLYACHKKDGSIDNTKTCLGERKTGNDGVSGWTKGCSPLSYQELKVRVTKWCAKLYQDGIYDYNQYQDCLKNLDTGTVSYYKRSEEDKVDDNKDINRIYGYYPKGQEKIDNVNPAIPIVQDDFQKMTLYHPIEKGFLTSDDKGGVNIANNLESRAEREWQLMDLSKGTIFALRSKYGKFLVGTDTDMVDATRENLTPWAQWTLIKQNDSYAFQSVVHKKYLTILNGIPYLQEGWSDKNLWIMKEKTITNGSFIKEVDTSEFRLKKDELMNEMENNYRKAIDNKFKRDYYKNKITQLKYLRDQQQDYLLMTSNKIQESLEARKTVLTNELEIIRNNVTSDSSNRKSELDIANAKFKNECKMSDECVSLALEYSAPGAPVKINDFSPAMLTRIGNIKTAKEKCKWTDDMTNKVIKRQYQEPTDEYCNDLESNIEALNITLATTNSEFNSMMNVKNDEISKINFKLLQLEAFRSDVKDEFDALKTKEEEALTKMSNDSENERLKNMEDYKKSSQEVKEYITYLASTNKDMEKEIKGIIDDIDAKLYENSKLKLDIEKNKSTIDETQLNSLIKENQSVIDDKLSSYWKLYYGSMFFILFIILLIIYMMYKTYKKYKS
jgi:hypothetical protein